MKSKKLYKLNMLINILMGVFTVAILGVVLGAERNFELYRNITYICFTAMFIILAWGIS